MSLSPYILVVDLSLALLADAKGRPTHTWYLKALGVPKEARCNDTVELGDELTGEYVGTMVYAPQCALCLERPAGVPSHDHVQCPLLGTLNKLRAQGELQALTFSSTGALVRKDEKTDLDIPKEVRRMRDGYAGLASEVAKLKELVATLVAKGSAPPQGQGKKRKPEEATQAGPSNAKKGKGGGGGGQGGQGGQQGKPPGGQQGGGKGKGEQTYRLWSPV